MITCTHCNATLDNGMHRTICRSPAEIARAKAEQDAHLAKQAAIMAVYEAACRWRTAYEHIAMASPRAMYFAETELAEAIDASLLLTPRTP